MKKFAATIWGLVFLWSAAAAAQSFDATVNRSRIPEGETFLLTLELNGGRTGSSPDLSALNADFTTYSVSNAFRTTIINGKARQSQQWNLVLMPNKTGRLTIPALKLDNLESKPITIEVSAAGSEINVPAGTDDSGKQLDKFSLKGSVDNKNPFVQEQIIYTLRLTDRGGLQGEEPYFEDNGSNDWIIKSLGAPEVNSQIINGQTTRELVFRYALFPQKSGSLTIPSVKFRGFYLTKESRSDPFGRFFGDDVFLGSFGMTDVFATKNPIFLSTKPIAVEVKPALEGTGKWWLPAQDVRIFAQFEPSKPDFKVGEAVTRTIYLQATGVIDSQLPEIEFAQAQGLKQYPEKPEAIMKVQNGQVVSTEKIANVYIPAQSGELTLPAINVPWFNVRTGQTETARIPEQKITVGGSAASIPAAQAPQPQAAQSGTAASLRPEIAQELPQSKIYLLLGAAFGLGIILSFALMKLFSGRNGEKSPGNPLKEIRSAAQNKDLRKLRDAVLRWAGNRYPKAQIFSLNDVEELVGDRSFGCELEKLGEALYAKQEAEWNAEAFLKVFEKVNKMKARRMHDDELLPKLYK